MTLQPTQHLNHEQLCDLLIGSQDNDSPSSVLIARREASQEHLRDCLICASEFDLMRSSVAGFHDAATALADRELARRPIRPRFAPIYGAQPRGLMTFAFAWATAALVVAAVIPLGLLNPRLQSGMQGPTPPPPNRPPPAIQPPTQTPPSSTASTRISPPPSPLQCSPSPAPPPRPPNPHPLTFRIRIQRTN